MKDLMQSFELWAQYDKRYAYCEKTENDLKFKGWIQNTL